MNLTRFARFATTEVILFSSLWFVYGMAINSSNLLEFGLQQAGVEAMVERHHFYLEGSASPQLQVRGDAFTYHGHTYANKQPGQFMAGAVVYFFLHLIGLSYVKNYLLVSALVTFFTTSLLTAIAGVVVFRLAQDFDEPETSRIWALATALVFGLGTTAFAYSGIAHHDAIGSAFLVIAFYLIFSISRNRWSERQKNLRAVLGGLFLGLTITTSMLPFYMALVLGAYFLFLREWKLLPAFVFGGILGLAPLLIYDAVNFGNPFLIPIVAGNRLAGHDPEAFFRLDWNNFVEKTNDYTKYITLYVPVFWVGLFGLLLFPGNHRREKYVLLISVAVLAAYLLNIEALGGCLYGPRYLLPAMPYVSVGLVGPRRLSLRKWKHAAIAVLGLICLFSIVVNLVGAVQGAMYCDPSNYGFKQYLSAILRGELKTFPLVPWLLPFVVALCLLPIVRETKRE